MLIRLKQLLKELSIKDFSNENQLNDVCFQIQEFLDINSGDTAAAFFSDENYRNALLSTRQKYEILKMYVISEIDCELNFN